jgi:hypothetical protein
MHWTKHYDADLIQGFADNNPPTIEVNLGFYLILGGGIAAKLLLWQLCKRATPSSDSLDALAADHRNDVASNSVAVATAGRFNCTCTYLCKDSIAIRVPLSSCVVLFCITSRQKLLSPFRFTERDTVSHILFTAAVSCVYVVLHVYSALCCTANSACSKSHISMVG